MTLSSRWRWVLPAALWLVSLGALVPFAATWAEGPWWDAHVYTAAMTALRAGHDPYADGVAIQQQYHRLLTEHPEAARAMPPFTYVYSPLTLPLLRLVARWPAQFNQLWYGSLFALGLVACYAVPLIFTRGRERLIFSLIVPAAIYFVGIILEYTVLSGNLAYILYGFMWATLLIGWRRSRWTPFYLAVLLASAYKAPMLSLLVIPALSVRRQWKPAAIVAAIGLALFASQGLIWPTAFHNYLQAVELQFSYNHDFGISPAGVLGYGLAAYGVSYSPWTTLFYLVYGAAVFLTLLFLARRFFAGEFPLERWAPVMLLGVLLLNPRIKQYDLAAMTVPLALVVWRTFARNNTLWRTVLECLLFGAFADAMARRVWLERGLVDCILVSVFFALGAWDLLQLPATSAGERMESTSAQNMSVLR